VGWLCRGFDDLVQRWKQLLQAKQPPDELFNRLTNHFKNYYLQRGMLHSSSAKAEFLFDLKQNYGDAAASGAYAFLHSSSQAEVRFTQGIIEGFLFSREIDWTASAHQEQLNKLRDDYASRIEGQDKRSQEIEERNRAINESFETLLQERKKALDDLQSDREKALNELHADQEKRFQELTKRHDEQFKAIEDAYDKKLALQKPIEYWEDRAEYHGRLAKWFGGIALLVGLAVGGGMAWLVHWIFNNLKVVADAAPPHWQVGILAVAAFFSIWLVRIFVRLFFSNTHLATDAAERKVMIQTFLSMAREGPEFAPEDKTLIVQHLFRSASDGLVKDDAAPPNWMSIFQNK
jgi:hypothetical protein